MLSRVGPQNLNRLSVNSFILEIDTTEVLVYEFEAVQTYTFKIITSRTTSKDFTNLVVTKNKNGLKETIIEYFPNAPWLTHPTEAFNGTSHIIDDVGNVLETFSTLSDSRPCTTRTITVNVPCTGGRHDEGDPDCICGQPGSDCEQGYSIPVFVIDCTSTGGGGNSGGNTSSPGWSNTSPYIPVTGIGSPGYFTGVTYPGSSYDNPGPGDSGITFDPDNGIDLVTFPFNRPKLTKDFADALSSNQLMDWWNNALNFSQTNLIYTWLFANPGQEDFAIWCVQFLKDNPEVTADQFENWFMTPREGQDALGYDATYWEDPNLTFQQQNLPTWNDFNTAYPRSAGEDLVQVVGGAVQQAYNQYPSLSRGYCALKVSRALNYSGVNIPEIITTSGNPGTLQGNDGKYYFLNAEALNKWMRETFGTNDSSDNYPYNENHYHFTAEEGGTNGENFPDLFNGLKGIYSMVSTNSQWASGHADLIENDICVFGCHLYDTPPAPIDYIDIWVLE